MCNATTKISGFDKFLGFPQMSKKVDNSKMFRVNLVQRYCFTSCIFQYCLIGDRNEFRKSG